MTHFKFRKNKKQKIETGLLLDNMHKQDFAGPLSSRASRVLGPISRHRVADILPHIVSRASRPGLLVGFFRIMDSALYRDFTQNMITVAVLDAQMNLTPLHTTENVPGCTHLFLSGDMLRYCFYEITCFMT